MAERARFLRHVRPLWEAHRHRVGPEVSSWVNGLADAGRLQFLAGRIEKNIEEEEGLARVEYRERRTQQLRVLRVAKVINCTGPRTDYSKFQHPLLLSLLAQGVITHDPLALGIDATPDAWSRASMASPFPGCTRWARCCKACCGKPWPSGNQRAGGSTGPATGVNHNGAGGWALVGNPK